MKNITYLFGAGASRNALPAMEGLPDRIIELIKLLESSEFRLPEQHSLAGPGFSITKENAQNEFLSELKWLHERAKSHASIDTYAKKLFVKHQGDDLRKLKIILSAFFVLEQARNPTDKRYDSFFAAILQQHKLDFPSNLKILSWNYDYQIEKAYSEYSDANELMYNQNMLRVISKNTLDRDIKDEFSIYKINGTTNIYSEQGRIQSPLISNIKSHLDPEYFTDLLLSYFVLKNNPKIFPSLSFAWEKGEHDATTIVNKCINGTNKTDILVVIGYSFPYFNREIDREIINSMKNLNKVYFQSPDAEALKERFLSIRDNIKNENLITRKDTEWFLIPNEL